MKNILLKFSNQVLSKSELKSVKGGGGSYGVGCGGCFAGSLMYTCNSVGPGDCICPATNGSSCTKN